VMFHLVHVKRLLRVEPEKQIIRKTIIMYKVIGSDGIEYEAETLPEVQEWIVKDKLLASKAENGEVTDI